MAQSTLSRSARTHTGWAGSGSAVALAELVEKVPAPRASGRRKISGQPRPMPGQMGVIVDDDPAMRAVLKLILHHEFSELREAANGFEALWILRRFRPSLAIVDVLMPLLDGVRLTEFVKADPLLAGTRVILVTADDDPAVARAGMEAGAETCLLKPLSVQALLAAVSSPPRLSVVMPDET